MYRCYHKTMSMDNDNKTRTPEEPKDPSVANEEKDINFLAEEEKERESVRDKGKDDRDERRREEWQRGIKEGKKNREEPPSFEKRDLNEQEEY